MLIICKGSMIKSDHTGIWRDVARLDDVLVRAETNKSQVSSVGKLTRADPPVIALVELSCPSLVSVGEATRWKYA